MSFPFFNKIFNWVVLYFTEEKYPLTRSELLLIFLRFHFLPFSLVEGIRVFSLLTSRASKKKNSPKFTKQSKFFERKLFHSFSSGFKSLWNILAAILPCLLETRKSFAQLKCSHCLFIYCEFNSIAILRVI